MSWTDTLRDALFGKSGYLDGEIVINVPETVYIKELAMYSAVSLIANAISQCEILVYENGKQVRNENWYSLNVQANVNESASRFWHKVIERMLYADSDKGAFVFVSNGNLYCADSYQIREKRPFKAAGNLYDGVVVDDLALNKTFTAKEVMIFKLEQNQANLAVANMYSDLGSIISSALTHFKDSNVQRWKFKIDAREAGNPEFQKEWQNKLKNAIRSYVDGDTNVFVEYTDKTLEPVTTNNSVGTRVNAEDNIKLINEVFDLVSRAYHIPPGLMTTGNYNISDLVTQFLTFVVDPTADMISKTLTAAYGKDEFIKGNYYRVDTSKIKHFDIFGMASDVDKLISSGFASVNEVRRAADWDPAGDPEDADNWLNQHILTKNYEKEGGETTT